MDVLVIDLASVRYQFNPGRTCCAALTASGELLAMVDLPPGTDDREAAFLAADSALERARAVRISEDGRRLSCQVSLYNPYTAQISVGAIPVTRVFTDGARLAVPAAGLLAELSVSTLTVGSRVLRVHEASFEDMPGTLAAHRIR